MIQEERVHFVHGEGWVRRLAHKGGAVRTSLVASLTRLWDETLCWFGPDDDPGMQRLYQEGILDASPDELRSRYLQKIMPTLSNLEIDVPVSFNATKKTGSQLTNFPGPPGMPPAGGYNKLWKPIGKPILSHPIQRHGDLSLLWSTDTEFFSLFGQQLLTEQYYCNTCHTPFEYIKDDVHVIPERTNA